MRRLDRQDLLAGLMFVAVGLFGWLFARHYPMGTALRMGPGYMPVGLSFILMTIGAIVAIRSICGGDLPTGIWKLRGLIFVVAGVLAFAILIDSLGLVASIVAMTVTAGLASTDSRPVEVAAAAVVMAAAAALIFVRGLQLPINIWPPGLLS
ncbi:MAG: tripartite tricarboxylate transporter TctB family protein [Alphaproteobacteria bacterium]|nr:tripartite tricarboxylate transporter TctB family protein [Alphaproteobacteria bacterium]